MNTSMLQLDAVKKGTLDGWGKATDQINRNVLYFFPLIFISFKH